ncbi:hypothetical protein DICSQDRAFT_101499 [Dichomitus squalens LYAD-421 SS1]|uniref:Beta-lactamase-like protein n=1 Tax=Dichomitus squalens TaxID=114155 RepID=A0A4Q9MS28_9APHY|nr:uncharacterized protein DICSQDRAFT_101499 [Dichomitus squalens LYAD-421 SS1]EJF63626.1 hypothetical protein DICSQDRAFT_101499 [Dichomitus squalens LYAD-421 SS1]TBU29352.1 hypothetical protein BD311DRAFT_756521 [Dichomitus squalens]
MTSKCAIREVTKDVWTFSCPFSRFNVFPVGARSTAIKLTNGDVWVLASSPLDDTVKNKLKELGPVKWIIGPDAVHHLFLGDFKKEFPEAKLIAVDEAIQKKKKEGLQFDGAWGKDSPDTKYGFEDDIKHCYFSGFKNKDVAFFHPASKTMLEADLLFNLPAREQYSMTGSSGKFPIFGNLNPYTWAHKRFAWTLGTDKEAMKRDVKAVAGWDFERIIPCHGDVIEKDGKAAWKEAYKWFLD